MNAPPPTRYALGRLVPRAATTEPELFLMRRRAWLEQGIAVLAVDLIRDDWVRQAITNEANRLYGEPARGQSR
jgi:hypothetical protein